MSDNDGSPYSIQKPFQVLRVNPNGSIRLQYMTFGVMDVSRPLSRFGYPLVGKELLAHLKAETLKQWPHEIFREIFDFKASQQLGLYQDGVTTLPPKP